jgi:hypothetical protein
MFHRFRPAKFTYGVWWFDFKLEPIFDTFPAASKNEACFKSALNYSKIIILQPLFRSVKPNVEDILISDLFII